MSGSVKIVTFVPNEKADSVRKALGEAGAGEIGEYSHCSYSVSGTGRFMPSENAKPSIGEKNKIESVKEDRIEVMCNKDKAKSAILAIKSVHPYEEVPIDIYPLISEEEL